MSKFLHPLRRPFISTRAGLTSAVARYPDWALYLAASGVGLAGGLVSVGFHHLITGGQALIVPLQRDLLENFPRAGFLFWPLLFIAFGLLLIGMERTLKRPFTGYSFPDYLHTTHRDKVRFSLGNTLPRVVAGGAALGIGLPVGREGPVAVGGGVIGARIARFLHMGEKFRKLLAAAGSAAAISATFGAPLTGVMFAQEIVIGGESELGHFALLILASATGAVTARALGAVEPTFAFRAFVWNSGWELLTYALLGCLLAVLAGLFTRWFLLLRRLKLKSRWPPWARVIAGLGLVGAVAAAVPVLGQWLDGSVPVSNLADGYDLTAIALSHGLPFKLLLLLLAAKVLTTPLAFESGAAGGLFGPALFIGAMAGGAFRYLSLQLLPGATGPMGAYALVGMATFLAILNRAPLTGLFLVLEMSGFGRGALPCLAAIGGALFVGRWLMPESLDHRLLAAEGRTLEAPAELEGLAADLPRLPAVTLSPQARLQEIWKALQRGNGAVAVVDAEGKFSGLIDWKGYAAAAAGDPDGLAVIAADLVDSDLPALDPETPAGEVAKLLERHAMLPVLNEDGKLDGMITRVELTQAMYKQLGRRH